MAYTKEQRNTTDLSHPLAVYEAAVADGTLRSDDAQRAVMQALDALYNDISNPDFFEPKRGIKRLFWGRKPEVTSHGMYVWGDVGRGKSMLMDMFYDQIGFKRKRRIHFHAFMQDVHQRLHAWRQLGRDGDLVPRVVDELSDEFCLLCLDEFQVHDVTDAMLLSQLFEGLFDAGVVVIITSNRPPRELYQGGLQRERFLEFVDIAEEKMQVLALHSDTDYRLQQLKSMNQVYYVPLGDEANEFLFEAYGTLTQEHESEPVTLMVSGRKLEVEKTACGVAWLTFAELCERPLGAADYLELARVFHTLILQDIPQLSKEKRNEAKRFVTLIDALYEQKVNLICSAEAKAEALYPSGDGAFEFQRTVSRLIEMQSESYLSTPHIA